MQFVETALANTFKRNIQLCKSYGVNRHYEERNSCLFCTHRMKSQLTELLQKRGFGNISYIHVKQTEWFRIYRARSLLGLAYLQLEVKTTLMFFTHSRCCTGIKCVRNCSFHQYLGYFEWPVILISLIFGSDVLDRQGIRYCVRACVHYWDVFVLDAREFIFNGLI